MGRTRPDQRSTCLRATCRCALEESAWSVQVHARGTTPVGEEKGAGGPTNHQMPPADWPLGCQNAPCEWKGDSSFANARRRWDGPCGNRRRDQDSTMRPTRDRRRLRDEEAHNTPPRNRSPPRASRERGVDTIPQRPHAGVPPHAIQCKGFVRRPNRSTLLERKMGQQSSTRRPESALPKAPIRQARRCAQPSPPPKVMPSVMPSSCRPPNGPGFRAYVPLGDGSGGGVQ